MTSELLSTIMSWRGDDPGLDRARPQRGAHDAAAAPLIILAAYRWTTAWIEVASRTPRYSIKSSLPVGIKQGTCGTARLLILVPRESPDRCTGEGQGMHANVQKRKIIHLIDRLNSL